MSRDLRGDLSNFCFTSINRPDLKLIDTPEMDMGRFVLQVRIN